MNLDSFKMKNQLKYLIKPKNKKYFYPMIILNRPQTDPYFNLAAEEYLVKNTKKPLFMLWQNTQTVVIGKHQNALKEVNLNYLREKNIPVIRRISGGGTVFHDLGNLNYSFIDFGARESLVNFKKYSQPILEVLQNMGIDAQLVGKSDLKINELKFSGNASHVHKNTVLHHGTLLFTSQLNDLESSIKGKVEDYSDKAVQSNRSTVTNIQSHLKTPMSLQDFKQQIFEHILLTNPNAEKRDFTKEEINEIQKLADTKYKTWEWNFGYSPRYQYNVDIADEKSSLSFMIDVKNGKIEDVIFESKSASVFLELRSIFVGSNHKPDSIAEIYDSNAEWFNTLKIKKSNLIKAFF